MKLSSPAYGALFVALREYVRTDAENTFTVFEFVQENIPIDGVHYGLLFGLNRLVRQAKRRLNCFQNGLLTASNDVADKTKFNVW